MDFVVSKVVMSICALMVISILGGMFGTGTLLSHRSELKSVAEEFCSLADSCALSDSETSVAWTVPYTVSGGRLRFELNNSVVRVESGEKVAVDQPVCSIHTWSFAMVPLNSSELASLDGGSPRIRANSGDRLFLTSHVMIIDQSWEILVFAKVGS